MYNWEDTDDMRPIQWRLAELADPWEGPKPNNAALADELEAMAAFIRKIFIPEGSKQT